MKRLLLFLLPLLAAAQPTTPISNPRLQGTGYVVTGATLAPQGSGTITATPGLTLDLLGTTRGSVIYRGASGWTLLTPGTSGYVLTSGGAGADPSWSAGGGGGGGVSSVGLTMPTGFSVANSPITGSGTLAVTTTLNGILRGTGSAFSTVTIGTGLTYDGTTLAATGGGGGNVTGSDLTAGKIIVGAGSAAIEAATPSISAGVISDVTNLAMTRTGADSTITIARGSGASATIGASTSNLYIGTGNGTDVALFTNNLGALTLSGTDQSAVFAGPITPLVGTGPTTNAAGEFAFDSNAWGTGRGAMQIFDGTANTYVLAALASDTPTNGQVPKWNTGGTITWEADSGGSPGGSSGDIQYNNAGSFGGITPGTGVVTALGQNVTGSGGIVLATSPTLTTPALGTPSAAVLTNATGLPISTGVSGLGTGIATALAINTGSAGAPVLFNGALGTPSSGTLTSATGLPLTTGVTGVLPIANGGTGAATTSQNFAFIGPTSGSGAPSFRALVAGDIPSLSGTYLPLAGGTMTGNITFNDTGEGISLHGGGAITGASGSIALAAASSGAAIAIGQGSSGNILLTAASSGNVGIGMSSPIYPLHIGAAGAAGFAVQSANTGGVQGPFMRMMRSRGTLSSPADVQNGDYTGSFLGQAASNGSFFNGAEIGFVVDGTFTTGQRPPSRMEFYTNTAGGSQTERLRISGDGVVKIFANTASASTITGAFQVVGGVGVGDAINAGSTVTSAGYRYAAAGGSTRLSAALGTDDTYTGEDIAGLNAGATIAQWEAIYVGGSSTYLLADANGSGTFPAFGIAATSGTNGNPLTIVIRGTVRNDAWNWTPGGAIYLSATPGALTQTAPSTSGDNVQVVGRALTADIAFFDFNSTYVTVE